MTSRIHFRARQDRESALKQAADADWTKMGGVSPEGGWWDGKPAEIMADRAFSSGSGNNSRWQTDQGRL